MPENLKKFKQERKTKLPLQDLKRRLDSDKQWLEKEKSTFSAATISKKRQVLLKIHRLLMSTEIQGAPSALVELKKRDPMLWDEFQINEVFDNLKALK